MWNYSIALSCLSGKHFSHLKPEQVHVSCMVFWLSTPAVNKCAIRNFLQNFEIDCGYDLDGIQVWWKGEGMHLNPDAAWLLF